MKQLLFASVLLVSLFLGGNAYATQESAEWGYEGDGKKVWLDDLTMTAKANNLNQGNNVGMWAKCIVGVSVVTGLFIWWKRKNS